MLHIIAQSFDLAPIVQTLDSAAGENWLHFPRESYLSSLWTTVAWRRGSELTYGALSIKPKMPEGSVRNQMERTISVWSVQKFWVHFDRSYQSDRNVPFHLTKLFSQVLLPSILYTGTMWRTLVNPPFLGKRLFPYLRPPSPFSLTLTWNFRVS